MFQSVCLNFSDQFLMKIGKVYAFVTGDPVPSFSPWPLSSEEEGAQWCGIINLFITSVHSEI